MQQGPIHLTFEYAGAHKIEETLDEHLAYSIEADVKWPVLAERWRRTMRPIQSSDDVAKVRIEAMTKYERLGDGVAQRSDPQLQRAAIRNGAGDVEAGSVFG
jgi:hypothetical protein